MAPPDPTTIRKAVSRLARAGSGLLIAAVMAFLVCVPRSALANQTSVLPPLLGTTPLITIDAFKPSVEDSGSAIVVETLSMPAPIVRERKFSDPALFKTLYVGYAAVQAGDILTTTTALNGRTREANPLVRDVAHSPTKLIGVKAATTVVMVLAIEKMRKRHPVVASVTLIAINATLAAVTINNASSAHRAKRVDE